MLKRYPLSLLYLTIMPLMGHAAVEEGDNLEIETIMVTAQKRQENQQEVPLAITSINGDTLREDGVGNIGDLGDKTPGLVFSAYSNAQPEIAIRGIGTKEDGAAANDSTVISIDDVYIAARSAQVFDLFDLERVEVLRGPQGTLYGKNSIGGSINFVTSRPTDYLSGRVSATVGNYGKRDIGGLISGPLTDNLISKLSFSKRDSDGYFKNVLNNTDEGGVDTIALRSQSVWTPTDNVEATITADWSNDDNENPSRQPLGIASDTKNGNAQLVSQAFGDPGDDPHISTADEPGYFKRTIKGLSAKVDVTLDNVTLTSVSAWRESEFDWLFDLNGVPGGPSSGSAEPSAGFGSDASNLVAENTRQVTQEFRLSPNELGDFDWIIGAFYSLETIERDERVCFNNCGLGVIFTAPQNVQPGNIINGSDQKNDATAWAIYGQSKWNINDKVSLTTGIRYSFEEKDVDIAGDNAFGEVPFGIVVSPGFGTPAWSISDTSDWSNVSGRIALDYKMTDDAMVYASASTGFKSGGYTGTASTPERALTPFDEEKAISYEVGLKSQWLDNSLRLNLSSFYTDYEDLQVTRFYIPVTVPSNTIGEFVTENAAAASIQGLEAELLWLFTENWELGGNYAYLDAEFDEFSPNTQNLGVDSNSDGFADSCGTGTTIGSVVNGQQGCIPDFSGNKLRQAPRNSSSGYVKYIVDTDSGTWSAKVTYRYQGKMYFDPDNNELAVTPSYDVLDARLGWNSLDGQWDVSLWAKNLTDEEYRTQIFSTGGGTRAFYNPGNPSTYGVTVAYRFE